MKKVVLSLAFVAVALVSCDKKADGEGKGDSVAADTVKTETTIEQTTTPDTTVTDTVKTDTVKTK